MRTRFNDLTVVHNEYHIRFADGRKSVRYNEARSALHHLGERILIPHFRTGINGGRCLVKDQHGGECEHNAGDTEKLLLSLRKSAVVADNGIVALGKALDEAVQ